jgi:hypothetical protein
MKSYPTYAHSIGLIFIWFGFGVLFGLPLISLLGADNIITITSIYVLSLASTILYSLKKRGSYDLELKPFSPHILLWVFVLIISLQVILDPLSEIIPESEMLKRLANDMKDQPLVFGLMAVVAAPLLEEGLFRGIILNGYLKNYKPMHGIVVSSLLFGLIHGNLQQGIGAFILGLIFGWLYWQTKSLLPSILLHFANNGLATVGIQFISKEDLSKTFRELISNDTLYFPIYALCLALCVGSIILLKKRFNSKEIFANGILTGPMPPAIKP